MPSSSKTKAFLKDFVADPAVNFVLVSDPLIFMTPEVLGHDVGHADVMYHTVAVQMVAGTFARAAASYVHVNNPEYKHAKFMDNLPLRISGYTHLGMGAFLAVAGQPREAAIAIPLGIGNLQLTGDISAAKKAMKNVLRDVMKMSFNGSVQNEKMHPIKALMQAYKSPDANFALANFAILLPPMQALAEATGDGGLNVEMIAKMVPALPLLFATYYIGKNVINNEKDSNEDFKVIHNDGYPILFVGATAGAGGMVGLGSLAAEGKLMSALDDFGGALLDAVNLGAHHVVNAQDAYVAAVSIASLTIAGAYVALENKYGTFFKPGRPKKTVIPLKAPDLDR